MCRKGSWIVRPAPNRFGAIFVHCTWPLWGPPEAPRRIGASREPTSVRRARLVGVRSNRARVSESIRKDHHSLHLVSALPGAEQLEAGGCEFRRKFRNVSELSRQRFPKHFGNINYLLT